MALPKNKLVPVLGLVALLIVSFVLYKQFSGSAVKSGGGLAAPIDPVAKKDGKKGLADSDTPEDTLRSVVAANTELRRQTQELMRDNDRLKKYGGMSEEAVDRIVAARVALQMEKQGFSKDPKDGKGAKEGKGDGTKPVDAGIDLGLGDPAAQIANNPTASGAPRPKLLDRLGNTIDETMGSAGKLVESLSLKRPQAAHPESTLPASRAARGPSDIPPGLGFEGGERGMPQDGAAVAYKVVAPLGYETAKGAKNGGLVRTRLGTSSGMPSSSAVGAAPTATSDGAAGPDTASAKAERAEPEPFFTIPQNATLTRVTTMTSIIGRVPIDGRVTDPMQFKIIIGRENLAANGHYVPDEISGIVASGVAVGDMAMSCSEGKIYSLTFVFWDGTVHTVNAGKGGGQGGSPAATGGGSGAFGGGRLPLGYISDLWGNPCIAGQFVTNAPRYLTDVVGLRSLGLAARAYAAAQTSTSTNGITGSETTAVTGSRGAYVMGQAAAGAADEVTNWVMSRLKNSFDAVVTPSGQKIVMHLDQEVAIDKVPGGRRLDSRRLAQGSARATATGVRHGLD